MLILCRDINPKVVLSSASYHERRMMIDEGSVWCGQWKRVSRGMLVLAATEQEGKKRKVAAAAVEKSTGEGVE